MKAKKKKKHIVQTIRKVWNVSPVTKVKPSKKVYKREKNYE